MDEDLVKSKLVEVITEMAISDVDAVQDIPDAIAYQILENYGSTVAPKLGDVTDDLDNFVKNLQTWLENRHPVDSNLTTEDEPNFELELYNEYLEAESEYCEVLKDLGGALAEAVKYKETYSEYFRDECKARDAKMEILNKKCMLLKLQFLSKLYEEENALLGHLTLRLKLEEELNMLKKKFKDLVEYNKRMSEIKTNKLFCELFKEYKELKKIEEITEILGKI